MIRLAAFLGNPGPEYRRNRHNAGRLAAEKLPFYGGIPWAKKFRGLFASIDRGEVSPSAGRVDPVLRPAAPRPVCLLLPETYMNLSGEPVSAAAAFFKIRPEEIIIVHDELELAPGFVSLRFGGGLGGHNGLRSIKQRLASADFWRLRIGIGRPAGRAPGEGGPPVKGVHAGGPGEIASWVLSDFGAAEEPALAAALEATAAALVLAFTDGPERLLPEWAKKSAAVTPA